MAQQTAVEWFFKWFNDNQEATHKQYAKAFEQAKAMEKEQLWYSKEDVLKAGEIGEINHHDYKHIVSLLDEAREINNK
jgi:hypothetical protein